MLVVHFLDGVEDLADSLEIFALTGMLPLEVRHNFSYFHSCCKIIGKIVKLLG
jgi:hypothetical protein